MASIVDRFFISVGLKTDDVKKGMADLDNKLTSGFKEIAANCIAPLAGALSAGALFNDFIQEAGQIKKLADSFKMSTEAVQEWRGAYEAAGIDADEFTSTFHDMNDYITDSVHNQSGPLQEMVDNYGLALTDMEGKTKGAETVMMEVADIFKKIGSQEAIGLAKRLGISDEVIPLFQKGSKGIRELMDRQKEMGFYTKEDTERAKELTEAIGEVTKSFKMSLVPIMTSVTPLLAKLGQMMTKVFILIREHSTVTKTVFAGLAIVLLASVVPSINAVKAASMALIRSPIGQFIALFVILGLVIEDLLVYIQGGESALPGLWSKFGTGEEIMAKFNDIMKTVGEYTEYVMQLWNEWGPVILKIIGILGLIWGVVMPIVKIVMMVWGVFMKVFNVVRIVITIISILTGVGVSMAAAIVAAVLAVIAILYILYDNWDTVKAWIGKGIDSMVGFFENAGIAIRKIWDDVCSWLEKKFSAVSDWLSSLKSGFLETIGLGEDASRVAASGRGGVNQSWYTDNSTKNIYPMAYNEGQSSSVIPSPNVSVRGVS